MAALFGWSVGDCVEGVKVTKKVIDVVADANKAPDELQQAEKTSEAIDGALRSLDTILTALGPPSPHANDIITVAQDVDGRETQYNAKRHKRYEKLTRDTARNKTRALPEKILWTLKGRADEERHQKDQQGSVYALQTGLLGYIVGQLNEDLAAVEGVRAQGVAHYDSIVQKATTVQDVVLQRMDETGDSLQQQQAALIGSIETKLDDISATLQDHTTGRTSNEQQVLEFLAGLQPLFKRVNQQLDLIECDNRSVSNASGKEPSSKEQTTVIDGQPSTDDVQPASQITTSVSPRRPCSLPRESKAPKRLEAISVLRIYSRSVEFTSYSTDADSSHTMPIISSTKGSVYLTLLIVILAACCELGLEMARRISSQASKQRGIPAAVSYFLLSDNIQFTDALGRNVNLSLAQTETWDMLHGWLCQRFKDGPGASKVQRGQFFIFDPRDPDRIISASTWRKAVEPRKRFQMGIIYSHRQLAEYCPKCLFEKKNTTLSGGTESSVRCRSCGTLYSSSALGPLRPTLRTLARSLIEKDAEPPGRRRLPYSMALAQAPLGMRYLDKEFSTLTKEPYPDDVDLDIDLENMDLETNIGDILPPPSLDDGKRRLTGLAYSHWKHEEVTEDQEEESVAYGPSPDMQREGDAEQRELVNFTTLWILRDSRLHDAALRGNSALARGLLAQGLDPNQRTGQTGSPLIAAIVSGSAEMVKLLLDNGADPLLPVQQGHTPVSVAACHGTDRVGHLVFPAAFRASYTRPGDFQAAVDRALYESATKQHEWHDFLLFIGANPAAPCPGLRETAFAKALKANDVTLLKRFLMVLWERQIFDQHETIVLTRAINGIEVSIDDNPEAWLRVCCVSLAAGDTQVFSREVNRRIRKRPDFYFRLNIGNIHCHPDMQRFWRDCENERKGIVVPPELAGLSV